MQLDASYGRFVGTPSFRPTVCRIAPGWWRLEWNRLAVEIDDCKQWNGRPHP